MGMGCFSTAGCCYGENTRREIMALTTDHFFLLLAARLHTTQTNDYGTEACSHIYCSNKMP